MIAANPSTAGTPTDSSSKTGNAISIASQMKCRAGLIRGASAALIIILLLILIRTQPLDRAIDLVKSKADGMGFCGPLALGAGYVVAAFAFFAGSALIFDHYPVESVKDVPSAERWRSASTRLSTNRSDRSSSSRAFTSPWSAPQAAVRSYPTERIKQHESRNNCRIRRGTCIRMIAGFVFKKARRKFVCRNSVTATARSSNRSRAPDWASPLATQ